MFTGFTVLPHPSEPGALLVHPTEVAARCGTSPEHIVARAEAAGLPLVSAWGQPSLLDLHDAATLAESIAAGTAVSVRANEARERFRETRALTRALKMLAAQKAEAEERRRAVQKHNDSIPARKAAALAAARAAGAVRDPDEGIPPIEAFLEKEAV